METLLKNVIYSRHLPTGLGTAASQECTAEIGAYLDLSISFETWGVWLLYVGFVPKEPMTEMGKFRSTY
jgi:hypothetical protein